MFCNSENIKEEIQCFIINVEKSATFGKVHNLNKKHSAISTQKPIIGVQKYIERYRDILTYLALRDQISSILNIAYNLSMNPSLIDGLILRMFPMLANAFQNVKVADSTLRKFLAH